MKKRLAAAIIGFCLGAALFASCATPRRALVAPSLGTGSTAATASSVSSEPPSPPPQRPPPPRITMPMPGEPDAAQLASARLLARDCSANEAEARDLVRRRVKAMRAELEEEWKGWMSLPPCEKVQGEGSLWSSGISAGGGGSAEGIGLGSTTTLAGSSHFVQTLNKAARASGTNNQVEGVDEADVVKNDGRYVYVAGYETLHIVEALNPRLVSVTKLDGGIRKMVVEGDRAVIFMAHGQSAHPECTYAYDCEFAGDGTSTRIAILDLGDRTHPKVVRRIDLSGSLIAARRIGRAVHAVVADNDAPQPSYSTTPDDLPWCREHIAAVRAKFEKLGRENERVIRAARLTFPTISDRGSSRKLCSAMQATKDEGGAFTTVVSFDMQDDSAPPKTATVQSRPGAVFVSDSALYLSVRHDASPYSFYRSEAELSDIHKFRVGASPAETRYVGSGVVPGHVLNQFAMDEWYGYLRVATTRGRVPDPAVESAISILAETSGGNLVRVGAIEHIARSEDIRAVRFDDDRGYIVTFKKTDPLFVADLYQPAAPQLLGELKIPGFSTYLHRIDPSHLLSIGFDADDHGDFAYFNGLLLQLFDVSVPTEPRLLHRETIGTRGSSSVAATDHLAFNYFAERNLLALPMTICEGGGDGQFGDQLTFSGLYVYDVSLDRGFRRLGGVDHGTRGASCTAWWSNPDSAVKRSIFMDDLVYSIASDRMKVQRLTELGTDVANIALSR